MRSMIFRGILALRGKFQLALLGAHLISCFWMNRRLELGESFLTRSGLVGGDWNMDVIFPYIYICICIYTYIYI